MTSVIPPKYALHISHQEAEYVKSTNSWPNASIFRNHACLLVCLYERVRSLFFRIHPEALQIIKNKKAAQLFE